MNAADFIVEYLVGLGVTDAFGIPGGVILELLYAMDRRAPAIRAHLAYHEQGAVFAACGYAQAGGKLGVAYATRGPGVTNMITGIADAYYDSIPLLVLTAHGCSRDRGAMRIAEDQEMDPIPVVSSITKYAARVERTDELRFEVEKACHLAASGRPGPVLLDIRSGILREEFDPSRYPAYVLPAERTDQTEEAVEGIKAALATARRPVLLIGDGVKQAGMTEAVRRLADRLGIPVLSSRAAEDVMPRSPLYFGYIGSHGTRYGNFILSKADLIIALGNRMSFPVGSASFRPLVERTKTIRIDVDATEFDREIPNSENYTVDLRSLLPQLLRGRLTVGDMTGWLVVCKELREELWACDATTPVKEIAGLMRSIEAGSALTCDVGNHEFWVSRAYTAAEIDNRVLYSRSFGALGCALPKAMGAYYATGRPVVCFVGDQGIQMNIQELQFVSANRLPIRIVLINNQSSGMIKSREKKAFAGRYIHTTLASGYSVPAMETVAKAYGLRYVRAGSAEAEGFSAAEGPLLFEMDVDEDIDLDPILPQGNDLQRLWPLLPDEQYKMLDEL